MKIEYISQVLPAIEGRKDFIHVIKDGYSVIDYVYQEPSTFDNPIRLECRGIKFAPDGKILARTLRKFFNLSEKEQPHEIDWNRPHVVLKKLDGSMVHPAYVHGTLVLMTRMGCTDVAEKAARRFLDGKYKVFMEDCLADGLTPSFEYTSPDNRIVLHYTEPALTLLAIRHTIDGTYLSFEETAKRATGYGIPIVSGLDDPIMDITSFIRHVRALEGEEGYVIRFDNSHMLKVKADDYLLKHRALSDMHSKKKVVLLVLGNGVDDVLPILGDADRERLTIFSAHLQQEISLAEEQISLLVKNYRHEDRKTFALRRVPQLDKWLQGAAFRHLDGKSARECVIEILQKHPELVKAPWAEVHNESWSEQEV